MTIVLAPPPWRTRFAPAPTGFLHLGHAINAIRVWGLARAFGGRVILRIEDHDRTRCRPEYETALFEDLDWLGFAPDDDLPEPCSRQSDREAVHGRALAALAARGLVYPCRCTRREIESAGEPGSEELRYPGTCRDRAVPPDSTPMRRIRLERDEVRFDDLRLGSQVQIPAEQCGDLLARDRDRCWTYQFAVTVDDLEQEIDLVVRGEDLLASTGRQIQLARLLGRSEPPRFLHHGLLRRPDGTKLSKANRDEGLRDLRKAGASPRRVLGLAAASAGLVDAAREISIDELVEVVRAREPEFARRLGWPPPVLLRAPDSAPAWSAARRLVEEYAASLGVDLGFQDLARELEHLRREYGPPAGDFRLAWVDGRALGCVGLRRFADGVGEIKRLYVAPPARGRGAGRLLARAIVESGRRLGYRRLVLDTLPSMRDAQALYATLGFRPIPAYRFNPVAGTAYLGLDLD
jgi:glutamyl-tRNA synthetase/glutamyl-Q tRNA(Asp) synthetase